MFGRLLQPLSDALLSHGDFKDSNFIIARGKLFYSILMPCGSTDSGGCSAKSLGGSACV